MGRRHSIFSYTCKPSYVTDAEDNIKKIKKIVENGDMCAEAMVAAIGEIVSKCA